jgi:hypothetical protein
LSRKVHAAAHDSDLEVIAGCVRHRDARHEPDLFPDSSRPNLEDKGQRKECGCIVSRDIGMSHTCQHLCTYCYANASCEVVQSNRLKHREGSDAIIS